MTLITGDETELVASVTQPASGSLANLRVGVVHYWLTGYGGGERALDSPSPQRELREKDLKRAAKITWGEYARKHVEVYRRVLAS